MGAGAQGTMARSALRAACAGPARVRVRVSAHAPCPEIGAQLPSPDTDHVAEADQASHPTTQRITSLATFSCACFRAGVGHLKFLVAKNGLYKKTKNAKYLLYRWQIGSTRITKVIRTFLVARW
jgi:hypothetical protein